MSTRAMYTFRDETSEHHVYKHYDGYPTGAAQWLEAALALAWPLPRFEADEFAAAFVAANKRGGGGERLMHSGSVYAVAPSDIAYRYEVTCKAGKLQVKAFSTSFWDVRSKKNEKRIFQGAFAAFKDAAEELERPGGCGAGRITTKRLPVVASKENAYIYGHATTLAGAKRVAERHIADRVLRVYHSSDPIKLRTGETLNGAWMALTFSTLLAIAELEKPGGCGAGRITIGRHVGEFNASVDERVVACAFLHDDGKLTVHDIVRGGEPQMANDPGRAHDLMLAIAKREADIADLQEPGGCGAQRLGIYWTERSVNKKTGPMPVSTTSAETCPNACPLAKAGCYAKTGNVGVLWHALTRHGPNASWKHGASMARSIDWVGLCERVAGLAEGTLWRHNQAGDLPHRKQRILKGQLGALVRANRGRRGFTYTHHVMSAWNRALVRWANATGFTINLSANTLAHADALSETGAGPVVVVQAFSAPRQDMTPAGRTVRTCPATYAEGVTCKRCQWCALPERSWIVGFPPHGGQKHAADAIARDLEIAYRGLAAPALARRAGIVLEAVLERSKRWSALLQCLAA